MKFKKIMLTLLSVVALLSIAAFTVSCAQSEVTDDPVSVSDSAVGSGSGQSTPVAKTVRYRVTYYVRNVDDDGFSVDREDRLTAEEGSTVNADIREYDFFTHIETDDSLESAVAAEGVSLKVYYERDAFAVTLASDQDGATLSGNGEYRYKKHVSVSTSVLPGYIFKGWYDGDEKVNDNIQFNYVVEKAVTLTAKWEAAEGTTYVTEYYGRNVDGTAYEKMETVQSVGTTDETAQAVVKTFDHFEHVVVEDSVESGVIAGDNSLVLKVYYDRNKYTVTLNGGDNAVTVTGAGEYYYGKTVSVSATSVGGFEFVAWKKGEEVYKDTVQFTLTVEEDIELTAEWTQTVFIGSVSQPQSLTQYYQNKSLKPDNIRNEFAFNDNPYYVGDDNAFTMKPIVSFVDEDYMPVEMPTGWDETGWSYNVKLEVYDEETENFVEIREEDFNAYIDNVDKKNCVIDFSADSIGKVYKIYIYPVGLESWQMDDLDDFSTNFEITVIDGYNVTKATDLIYINNIVEGVIPDYVTGNTDFNGGAMWNAFAKENKIDMSENHKAVILHNDITVTAADVPSGFFYKQSDADVKETDADYGRIEGSLRDFVDVYYRKLAENEEFIIEGNYFTLDCGKFPLVVRPYKDPTPEGEKFESHAQIFRFQADENNETGVAKIRNINLVGNAEKTENIQKAGGLILVKSTNAALEALNNISNCWYINYFPDSSTKKVNMSYCRAYDSFNCIVYVWGANKVTVDHCDFNGAGGPVFIVDHIHQTGTDITTGLPSNVVVTDSSLHSFVVGTEAWFDMYHATSVAGLLKGMNVAFTPFGRSYVVENKSDSNVKYLDLIAVYKSSAEAGISQAMNVTGYFRMNGASRPMDFGTYDLANIAATDPALAAKMQVLSGTIATTKKMNTVTFVSSESSLEIANVGENYMAEGAGIFYATDTETLAGAALIDGFQQPITDPNNTLFKGDQLYLYTQIGLCAVVGYYDVNTAVDPTDIGSFIIERE